MIDFNEEIYDNPSGGIRGTHGYPILTENHSS